MSVIKQAIEALRRKSIAEAIGLLSRRPISFGIEGGADISGILPIKVGSATLGLRLEVEVKTGLDKMRDSQIAFRVMILAGGGVYVVARSVEQCLEELGRWG
jgi:hypothetical protein